MKVEITLDRAELAETLGVPEDELDELCLGHVDEVLRESEGDFEDYVMELVRNRDYDLGLVFSEKMDAISRKAAMEWLSQNPLRQ